MFSPKMVLYVRWSTATDASVDAVVDITDAGQ